MQRLVDADPGSVNLMTPSYYASAAKERNLGIITWTLERAGPGMGGWYYGSTEADVELAEGDRFTLLHVLDEEVGILGIFSDWPATSTFYANCVQKNLREEPDMLISEPDLDTEDDYEVNGGDETPNLENSQVNGDSGSGCALLATKACFAFAISIMFLVL